MGERKGRDFVWSCSEDRWFKGKKRLKIQKKQNIGYFLKNKEINKRRSWNSDLRVEMRMPVEGIKGLFKCKVNVLNWKYSTWGVIIQIVDYYSGHVIYGRGGKEDYEKQGRVQENIKIGRIERSLSGAAARTGDLNEKRN